MVLTEAFAAGTPVIASQHRRLRRRRQRRRRRGPGPARRPPAPRRGAAAHVRRAGAARSRWARAAREPAPSATPGRGSPPQVERVYERGVAHARARPLRPSASPAASGFVPIDGSPPVPRQRLPSARSRARRATGGKAPHRPPRSASASRASSALGLTSSPRRRIGLDKVVASIVRSDLGWVLIATALMMASMFLRAASWFEIATRGAAAQPAAPPRRGLGDDDRRADVGDPAGPPRRAGARDGARPAHRPDARDVPGAARHARLADRPQHPRAGAARA